MDIGNKGCFAALLHIYFNLSCSDVVEGAVMAAWTQFYDWVILICYCRTCIIMFLEQEKAGESDIFFIILFRVYFYSRAATLIIFRFVSVVHKLQNSKLEGLLVLLGNNKDI